MAKTKTNVDCISAQLPSHPARFTLTEWHLDNQFRHRCTKAQQESSDRLLAEGRRVCELAREIVRANKEETDHQLRAKLDDIEFRQKELLRIRRDVVLEIDALLTYKERLVDALKSVRENALAICEKCLVARENRLGIDLVHDDVERELLREREVIQTAESSLDRIFEETCEQIRKLKSVLYCIDRDLENKEDNLFIDRRNVALKESDFNLSSCHDTSPHDKSIPLSEWEQQTNNNVIDANKEVNSAKRLRCYVDKMVKRIIDDLNKQKDVTNEAFKRRIEQTQEAKIKLELQHSEIVKQIAATSSNITHMKKSIADKEGYMALAHARLGYRHQRPGTELTEDLVEANLVKEVHELRNVAANLQRMLCEAEASLRHLLRTQVQLEEDINVKTNTLKIDEVECTTLRHSMDYHAY